MRHRTYIIKLERTYQITRRLLASALLLAGVIAEPARAATYTWTGETDFLWSNPSNWSGLVAPQAGEQNVSVVFPNTGAPRNTTNDVLNLVISSMLFQGANYSVHEFQIEINGTTPGVNCDQLEVNGGVGLVGGNLQLAMNFTGAVSNEYVIVKNDGADPVSGIFAGLAEDAVVMANGVAFQISYQGGDGNDIALIQRSLAGVGPQLDGIQQLADGRIQIGGTGIPNATYHVDATESLIAPVTWIEIGSATAEVSGQFQFIDPDAASYLIRFYRSRLP